MYSRFTGARRRDRAKSKRKTMQSRKSAPARTASDGPGGVSSWKTMITMDITLSRPMNSS